MTASTHRRFSVTFALIGAMLLKQDLVNYYLVTIMLVTFSKFGGLFSDLDLNWHSVKEKTDFNRILNGILRITGAKHRSWQTHSWDIAILFTVLSFKMPDMVYSRYYIITDIDREIIRIILVGFSLGWLSHLFADMLNNTGVRLLCWWKFKIKLVPKQLFGLKFKTGEDWERFCNSLYKYINRVLAIVVILYPIIN